MSSMQIERLVVSSFATNCFIVTCTATKKALVIDPGAEADRILGTVQRAGAEIAAVVLTHGHVDHIGATDDLVESAGPKVYMHESGWPMLTDPDLNLSSFIGPSVSLSVKPEPANEASPIAVGGLSFTVLHTPGHSPGGISLVCGTVCFSGDALFNGSIGRTDFPGSDHELLLTSIRRKLFTLPDETEVYSGHGEKTTIGYEKQHNPFL